MYMWLMKLHPYHVVLVQTKKCQTFSMKSPKLYESLMNVFLVTFTIGFSLMWLMSHVHKGPKHIILLNYVFLLICEVK